MSRYNIKDLVAKFGVDGLRFFIPMRPVHSLHALGLPLGITSRGDEDVIKECRIDERRYKMKDNFKIELRPVDEGETEQYFGTDTFYIMDLESMLESGNRVRIKAIVNDKLMEIETEKV